MDDKREAAREAMLEFDVGEEWLEAVDPGSPAWLTEWQRDTIEAYRTADVDWLLQIADPEIEIVQPTEFPDATTYRGPEAMIDALLDWPREWEDFEVEPKRIFAPNDNQCVVVATHRGRSRSYGVDVEAEVVWLYTLRDERIKRWEMYMSLDAAMDAVENDGGG
jgi:ketosteroid isomerase-like protein